MRDRTPKPQTDDERPRPGESFFSRFRRRKAEARARDAAPTPTAVEADELKTEPAVEDGTDAPPLALTDADMPPLETLGADSDYTGFLSPQVSEPLRRAALRKLFHGAEFNVLDELDDYAEDFTSFTALGDIVTSDMRHLLATEAKKQAEALRQALLEGDAEAAGQTAQLDHDEDGGAPPAFLPEDRAAGLDAADDPPTEETRRTDA